MFTLYLASFQKSLFMENQVRLQGIPYYINPPNDIIRAAIHNLGFLTVNKEHNSTTQDETEEKSVGRWEIVLSQSSKYYHK